MTKELNVPNIKGELPPGNDGLVCWLGITGDEILNLHLRGIKTKALANQCSGTVQADILKEDQAQNTCIFSTEFSLKLLGRCTRVFYYRGVRNFIQFLLVAIILQK